MAESVVVLENPFLIGKLVVDLVCILYACESLEHGGDLEIAVMMSMHK